MAALALASALGAVSSAAHAQRPPASAAEIALSFSSVVRRAAPAVVNINTRARSRSRLAGPFANDPFFRYFLDRFDGFEPRRRESGSLGSGVIVRSSGLIVTNHHVIEGASAITVDLIDRRSFEAEVVAVDEAADLALLSIDPQGESLPALAFSSSDDAQVGDLVLAIGNPFGIGQTVTSGIVSAKGRTHPNLEADVTFLQTDAAINPGSSGGALIGLDGALLGVNTAIFTRGGGSIGIGFAVPADYVRAFVERSERGEGDGARPWLGARLQSVDGALAAGLGLDVPRGVVLTEVYPGSTADLAGLRRSDVVLEIDGAPIADVAALRYRLALAGLGAEVRMRVLSRGEEREVDAILTGAPAVPPPDVSVMDMRSPLAGLTVANLSPAFAMQLGMDPFASGVVALEVARGSRAAQLGFRPRDRIVGLDGREVRDVASLREAFSRGARWRLSIRRDGRLFSFLLRR